MKKRTIALILVLLLCMACLPALADGNAAAGSLALPDLSAFLGNVAPKEETPAYYAGRRQYYKLSIDEGWQAGIEYVQLLLNDPRYQFEQADFYSATVFTLHEEIYFLDYVGKEEITPAGDRYYPDGYQDFTADVTVRLQRVADKGYTSITLYYSSDLILGDYGDRSSIVPSSATGSSGTGITHDKPYTPDFAKMDCLTCGGDGDCNRCGGYGTIQQYSGNGEYTKTLCPDCRGNGKCKKCGGSGTRD